MNTTSIKYNTIAEILQFRAKSEPNQLAYTFLVDGENNELSITYRELDTEARKIGRYLQSHCKKGDRAVLFYPPGLDFIKAFFGCLYSGIIAVPSYPPKMNRSAERMNTILSDASPSILLSTSDAGYEKTIKKYLSVDVPIVNSDDIKFEYSKNIKDANIIPEDLAFLQYTSGSTGTPKGVMISHKNLLHNEYIIQQSFGLSKSSVVVGWLPFYHDMGLIGNILQPVFTGFPCILMTPVHFLQKPVRWLQAISKYKATVSGGPNFSYDLCCEKIFEKDIEGIKLDTWKVAFNGAEPVRAGTLKKFYKKFGKYGFTKKAFLPCYGMAETTLLVSGIDVDKEPVAQEFLLKELQYQQNEFTERLNGDKIELVSCGNWNGFNLVLVDEKGDEAKDGIIGEIWLKGNSVANGYWNNQKESDYTFKAKINGQNESYLRTGDLGIKKNGELYIAGRIKDLIILNGRNYYPQDIEFAVGQSNNLVVKESIAAFSIDAKTEEQLIIAAEIEYQTDTKTKNILQDIKRKIVDEFEIIANNIVLVRKGTLLKTTSGKIQRRACKEAYLSNSLHTVGALLSEVNVEKSDLTTLNQKELEIFNIIKEELNNQVIKKDTDLFNIGLDSIRLTRIAYRLGEHYDKEVPADFVIENNTISKIAKNISCLDEFKPFIHHKEGDSFPVSKLQEVIWFNQQRNPEGTGYNIPVILDYDEALKIDILEESIRSLINKYNVLRTNFQLDGNTIIQKIKSSAETNINFIDLSGLKDSVLEKQVSLSIKNESVKLFNLEKDSLIRTALIKKASKKYSFLIVIHHILVDGTSVVLLLKELKETYQRLLKGENTWKTLPAYDFVDYTLYEETRLSDNELINKKKFWLEELNGELPKLDLPFDYSIVESKSREGKSFYFKIDQDLWNKLKTTVKETKLNQFSYLLTAYYLLLHRLSGSNDLVVGTPVSMRQRKELENMPGLLINTAMFRTKLKHEGTLKELVNNVYEHSRLVLKHADYPFNQVLRDLQVPIGENQLAISSVFFNYLDFTNNNEANQLFDTYKANPGVDLNFDLNLYALPENDHIKFRLDYCKNHFKENSIEKFAELYIKILSEIVRSPKTVLKDMQSEITETRNTVIPWNDFEPFTESDIQKSITEKFNEVSVKYPARIALKTNTEKYTYSEINELSYDIARQIELCSSNRSFAIGLLFGHESNMILSILGVLKSGNYYVPLDSEYPFDRLVYILNDADIHVILTNNQNLPKAKELVEKSKNNVQLINLDKRNSSNTKLIHKDRNNPGSLAYILYTSGSTGTPKGVMQTHEYVMHLTYSFTNSLHISKDDCFTLIPSFNFSASVMDLFGVLLNGASLYLVDIKKEGIHGLVKGMEREEVTVYHSVPTVFREVTSCELQVTSLKKLRLIYLAGEPLLRSDVELYKTSFHDDCILVNGLGCTEFNICRQFFIDKQTDVSTSIVPIGYKAIGVDLLIVDENRVETKNHEPGEIAIRSKYLSIGYWNSVDLTEQKFKVINPETKERIYYTGDLGRRLADGCMMHLGRKDFQVKLRGQRIELTEIETAMLKIDGINRAVVSLKENTTGKFLCGYYIQNKEIEVEFLKKEVAKALPAYMVPSYFLQMESFPLTDTGKIDRRNLPLPEVPVQIGDTCELTKDEIRLSKIWAEVLKIDQTKITKNTNFFEIGGNSLSAIQLIQKIHKVFNSKISLHDLFEKPTIQDITQFLRKHTLNEITKIPNVEKKEYYLTSFTQRLMYMSQLLHEKSNAYNVPLIAEIAGILNVDKLIDTFRKLIQRHEILHTSFYIIDNKIVQKIEEAQFIPFEYIEVPEDRVSEIIKQAIQPFNIKEYPLYRILLLKTDETKHVLLFDMHHIITDGVSIQVVVKDLMDIYEEKEIIPLKIQYKDYSEWNNKFMQSEEINNQEKYWLNKFKGEIPKFSMRLDFPRPSIKDISKANEIQFVIEAKQLQEIKILITNNRSTLYSFLLTIYNILLHKYSGQCDIIIGSPVAGRPDFELQNAIGAFINMAPMRNEFTPCESFQELLKKITSNAVDTFLNQDYPFENLLIKLGIKGETNRNPLFDHVLTFHNFDFNSLENSHLKFTHYKTDFTFSKYDLQFVGYEINNSIQMKMRYSTELFKESTAKMITKHFIEIINIVVENPEIEIQGIVFNQNLTKTITKIGLESEFSF